MITIGTNFAVVPSELSSIELEEKCITVATKNGHSNNIFFGTIEEAYKAFQNTLTILEVELKR